MTGICERCRHAEHLGECGVEVAKGPILSDCGCFVVATVTDVETLRRRDAAQQRALAELRQNQLRGRRPLHRAEGPGVPVEVYSSIGYVERDGDRLPWEEGESDG